MTLLTRRSRSDALPGVTGTARVDRRLSEVLRRARAGDVLVIEHTDLDRTWAEALVNRGVVAVVNAAPFISGRFPNLGPEVLAAAGIVLVDRVGADVFAAVRDGHPVRVAEGTVFADEQPVASGRPLTLAEVRGQMDQAREGLVTQLESLTSHTIEFLRREQGLLLHGQGVPELSVPIAARPVVVVQRALDHESELKGLRRFITDRRPVLLGVDSGADALLAAGLEPAVVVLGREGLTARADTGVRPAVSDRALTTARQVLVQVDGVGRPAAGEQVERLERLERLGVRPVPISAGGSAADVALLVADVLGASMIVSVGASHSLEELLDQHRAGQAASFATRMRVGPRMVDARLVPTLSPATVRVWQLALALLVGLLAVTVAVAATPVGSEWFDTLGAALGSAWDEMGDRVGVQGPGSP